MVYLISCPDQVKNKILASFASFASLWFIFSFFSRQNVVSRTFGQYMHRVKIRSQRSEIVGQKSVRSKLSYPARVVGGKMAEDLFDRGLCLPSGTAMTNADLDRIIDVIISCHQG